jgi:hypothetical protein
MKAFAAEPTGAEARFPLLAEAARFHTRCKILFQGERRNELDFKPLEAHFWPALSMGRLFAIHCSLTPLTDSGPVAPE